LTVARSRLESWDSGADFTVQAAKGDMVIVLDVPLRFAHRTNPVARVEGCNLGTNHLGLKLG